MSGGRRQHTGKGSAGREGAEVQGSTGPVMAPRDR
jgi:hypothetical protein